MERKMLDAEALASALNELDDWRAEDKHLKRRWKFENFAEALGFVNRVGELAEAADAFAFLADGTFEAKDILAGRMRVRAWRAGQTRSPARCADAHNDPPDESSRLPRRAFHL